MYHGIMSDGRRWCLCVREAA